MKITKSQLEQLIKETIKEKGGSEKIQKLISENVNKRLFEDNKEKDITNFFNKLGDNTTTAFSEEALRKVKEYIQRIKSGKESYDSIVRGLPKITKNLLDQELNKNNEGDSTSNLSHGTGNVEQEPFRYNKNIPLLSPKTIGYIKEFNKILSVCQLDETGRNLDNFMFVCEEIPKLPRIIDKIKVDVLDIIF